MRIEHSKRAARTPAAPLIVEAWNDVVQEGFTSDLEGVFPVKPDDVVLFAVSPEGDIVGVLTYGLVPPDAVVEVTIAYVEPSSRKRGVFKALLAELRERAKRVGAEGVTMKVPAQNAPFQAVMRRLNAPAASVVYEIAVV